MKIYDENFTKEVIERVLKKRLDSDMQTEVLSHIASRLDMDYDGRGEYRILRDELLVNYFDSHLVKCPEHADKYLASEKYLKTLDITDSAKSETIGYPLRVIDTSENISGDYFFSYELTFTKGEDKKNNLHMSHIFRPSWSDTPWSIVNNYGDKISFFYKKEDFFTDIRNWQSIKNFSYKTIYGFFENYLKSIDVTLKDNPELDKKIQVRSHALEVIIESRFGC